MISPTNTISPEWQNENAMRAYPLKDDAPAASLVPGWLISDLRVTCSDAYDVVYVSSVYVSHALLSVGISGRIGTNPPVGLLTKTVTRDELEPYRAYSMDRISETASGTIAFGAAHDDPYYLKISFTSDEAPLVQSSIVRVKAPGVTRIIDPYHGTSATGIIDLSGNSEFRTSIDPSDPHTIVVRLSDLYRDLTTSVCDAVPGFDTCGETPVKSINGVTPTLEQTVIGGETIPPGVIFINFR
jgi:hypothetical protein